MQVLRRHDGEGAQPMTVRPDMSDKLVHFTSGADEEDAYARLRTIVEEGRLVGSGAKIQGKFPCVCFSEAPLASLPNGLVNPSAYSRYLPFGIVVDKCWVCDRDGRPVIYQPDSDFSALPKPMRWRHVRYEPGTYDFTWEREWRVQCEELGFEPHEAGIVVPTRDWAERLKAEHRTEQDLVVQQYAQVMDETLAGQYREDFPWRVCPLS